MNAIERQLHQLDQRMARIESRLCQLMFHLGLDPNVRMYDEPRATCPLDEYIDKEKRRDGIVT